MPSAKPKVKVETFDQSPMIRLLPLRSAKRHSGLTPEVFASGSPKCGPDSTVD
jgi:hypothetical protein